MANHNNEIAFFPSSDAQWLLLAVKAAAQMAGCTLSSLDTANDSTDANVATRELISRATAIIADFTNFSPEVMFSVGMAQGLGKPIIPLVMNFGDVPANLRSIQFLAIAEFREEVAFVNRLAAFLSDVVKSPNNYSYESTLAVHSKKQNIFISYSHKDDEYLKRLLVHLRPLEKQGILDKWVDTDLRAGDKWKDKIQKALECATVAILIISADFLASEFIVDNELPPLLKSAEEKGTRIIPLIAKSCRFTRDPNLKHFHSINNPQKPLVLLDEGNQEKVFDELCAEVERYVNKG